MDVEQWRGSRFRWNLFLPAVHHRPDRNTDRPVAIKKRNCSAHFSIGYSTLDTSDGRTSASASGKSRHCRNAAIRGASLRCIFCVCSRFNRDRSFHRDGVALCGRVWGSRDPFDCVCCNVREAGAIVGFKSVNFAVLFNPEPQATVSANAVACGSGLND